MPLAGIYGGTKADGTKQIFDKQPWETYFPEIDIEIYGSSELTEQTRERYGVVHTTERTSDALWSKIISSFVDTMEYIESRDPDIIFQLMRYRAHGPGVALACRINNIPFVGRLTGDVFGEHQAFSGLRKAGVLATSNGLGRLPIQFADSMIVLGPYGEKQVQQLTGSNPSTYIIPPILRDSLPFGESDDRLGLCSELGASPDQTICLYTGRVSEMKGMPFLIDTARELEHEDILFLVVGSGHYETVIHDSDLENITCTGRVPYEEISRYYAISDIYFHPSSYEGVPLSILEAKKADLPVIARKAGDLDYVTSNIVYTPQQAATMIRTRSYEESERLPVEFTPESAREQMTKLIKEVCNDCQ